MVGRLFVQQRAPREISVTDLQSCSLFSLRFTVVFSLISNSREHSSAVDFFSLALVMNGQENGFCHRLFIKRISRDA